MNDASLLPLMVLGIVAGGSGLYLLLTVSDEPLGFARWLGGALLATGLLPVLALCIDAQNRWPDSAWNRWHWLILLALLIAGANISALVVVVTREPAIRWSALATVLLLTAALCALEGGVVSAVVLLACAAVVIALVWRGSDAGAEAHRTVAAAALVEPLLGCCMAAFLAAALVGAIHMSLARGPAEAAERRGQHRSATARAAAAASLPPAQADEGLPNRRLAHHSLTGAALVVVAGLLGVCTRSEGAAVLPCAAVVLVGLVWSLVSFGGLHEQRTGDVFAVTALGLAALVAVGARSWLFNKLHAGLDEHASVDSVGAERAQRSLLEKQHG
jgi:NADH:ubiquinone oxidoreductase subunit K